MSHSTDSSSDVIFSAWAEDEPLDQWYVDLGGVRLGPLDRDAVIEMYESGNLRLDDRVQQVGCHDWGYVKQLCSRDTEDSSRGSSFIPDAMPEPASRQTDPSADEFSSEEAFDISASQLDEPETVTKTTTAKRARRKSDASATDRQYYFQSDDQEVGPVTLSTLQELANEGAIVADTPVRLEDRAVWLTAKSLGIRCPDVVKESEPVPVSIVLPGIKVDTKPQESRPRSSPQSHQAVGKGLISGAFWLLFAPLYSLAGLCRNAKSTKLSLVITILVAVAAVGFWGHHIYLDRMTIITTGTVLLDETPAASVVITLSNLTTGESAIGVTDSNGAFQLKSLRGTLSPGRYRVTVFRPADFEVDNDVSPIPKSYMSEATSGLDVDFNGSEIEVRLTSDGT